MKNLGFGMMRLPVIDGQPTNFNYKELNKMVDAFLEAGYNYFDTSYVYHNGKSEEATRKALVERHPRESFRVATKFPSFIPMSEEDVEKTFAQQLENLGVEYIDYYLLHNLGSTRTEFFEKWDMWEWAKQMKADGKIRHLGFSFHDNAETLKRVLDKHADDAEFIQLQINVDMLRGVEFGQ